MVKIFNDFTNQLEEFRPLHAGKVNMYVCGITTYDSPHLGHARSAVSFDIIRRYFEYRGFQVKFVMNYTDVDDHMINRSNSLSVSIYELAEKYITEYEHMQKALRIKPPTIKPRATQEISEIIQLIQNLEKKGVTYEAEGGLYYDTTKFPNYKTLFRKKEIEENPEPSSFTQSEFLEDKRNVEDFVLWKKEKPGEPSWDSPWGKGRPGWHIECSTMSMKYLGKTIDIHGGGKDLKQPHHQNEIAQSEMATGKPFVRYWMHNGFLNIDRTKMSKSLGNFIPLMDMLGKYPGILLRYYFASSYYQRPIDFSMDKFEQAQKNLDRIQRFYLTAKQAPVAIESSDLTAQFQSHQDALQEYMNQFFDAMDTDFNTAMAMGHLFNYMNYASKHLLSSRIPLPYALKSFMLDFLENIDSFLDFIVVDESEISPVTLLSSEEGGNWKAKFSQLVEKLLEYRKAMKIAKDYAAADQIRKLLGDLGVEVEDKGQNSTWTLKSA